MLNKDETQKLRDVKIITLLGVADTGRRISVRCPVHKERTPSFVVYADNSYHCFGCGIHGAGAIDFVVALGVTFAEACEELKKYI